MNLPCYPRIFHENFGTEKSEELYPLTHGNDSFDGRPNDKPERKDLNQQQIDSLELKQA